METICVGTLSKAVGEGYTTAVALHDGARR
jgi:hypothetical protein